MQCPLSTALLRIRKHPIDPIQRRHPVGFRHRRVVERRVDEVEEAVRAALLGHDGLPDVDDLGGLIAEAVDSQNPERLAVEEQLEHAHRLAADQGAREVPEVRVADLIVLLSRYRLRLFLNGANKLCLR